MLQVIKKANVSDINVPSSITHTVDKQHQTTEKIPRVKATNVMQLDITKQTLGDNSFNIYCPKIPHCNILKYVPDAQCTL
jgi:hypothetical protein